MQTEIITRLTAGVRKSVVRLDEQFSLRDAPLFHTRMIWHFDHDLNVVVYFYAAVKCQNESSASWTCFFCYVVWGCRISSRHGTIKLDMKACCDLSLLNIPSTNISMKDMLCGSFLQQYPS